MGVEKGGEREEGGREGGREERHTRERERARERAMKVKACHGCRWLVSPPPAPQ